ncbi:hypothetical protein Nepgr_010375 [Nepenthes gracilis]|uniref:Uncharacterized protein n=1 Tax=Nepenthes gracilis TaxID=150966 RepID=A0AAD3XL92_NEPGR|nr:hypothetical protein Nepgr_010375 [Nepenthes gracilis]
MESTPSIKPSHFSYVNSSTTPQGHYLLTQQMTTSPTASLRKRARTTQSNCYSNAIKLHLRLHQHRRPHQFYPPDSIACCSGLLGNCGMPQSQQATVTRCICTSRNRPGIQEAEAATLKYRIERQLLADITWGVGLKMPACWQMLHCLVGVTRTGCSSFVAAYAGIS